MEQLIENSLKLGFGLMRLPRLESGEIDLMDKAVKAEPMTRKEEVNE